MKELMENWRDYEKEIISEAALAAAAPVLMPGAVEAALGAMAAEAGAAVSGAGSVASGMVAPVIAGTAVGAAAGIEAIHQVTGIPRRGVLDRAIIGAMSITDFFSGGKSAQKYHSAVTTPVTSSASPPVSVSPEMLQNNPALMSHIQSTMSMSDAEVAPAIDAIGLGEHLAELDTDEYIDLMLDLSGPMNTPPEPPKEPMSTKAKVALGLGGTAIAAGTGGAYLYKKHKDAERDAELAAAGLSDPEVQADLEDVATGGAGDGTSGEVGGNAGEEAKESAEDRQKRWETEHPLEESATRTKEIVREEVIKFLSNRRKK